MTNKLDAAEVTTTENDIKLTKGKFNIFSIKYIIVFNFVQKHEQISCNIT